MLGEVGRWALPDAGMAVLVHDPHKLRLGFTVFRIHRQGYTSVWARYGSQAAAEKHVTDNGGEAVVSGTRQF